MRRGSPALATGAPPSLRRRRANVAFASDYAFRGISQPLERVVRIRTGESDHEALTPVTPGCANAS